MDRLIAAFVLAAGLAGCSPTLNWRQVRAAPSPLAAMFPCKPDQAVRQVPMAGRTVDLQGLGCEAGGATFVVFFADLGEPGRSGPALAQWRQATLANLRAADGQDRPFVPAGALALPQSVRVSAQGRRSDGTAVHSEAAYFARGSQVFQAAVYAPRMSADSEAFFEGLRFP